MSVPPAGRVSVVLVASALVVVAIAAAALLAWQQWGAIAPAEMTLEAERRAAAGLDLPPGQAAPTPARMAAFIGACRDAARADIWPGRVLRFDPDVATPGIDPYVTPRGDGLPVVRLAPRTPSDVALPMAVPASGRFGLSGSVDYKPWLSDQPSNRRYFCELDASSTSIDVKAVSIEVVR